jgi:hypothetical protein
LYQRLLADSYQGFVKAHSAALASGKDHGANIGVFHRKKVGEQRLKYNKTLHREDTDREP